MSSHFHQFIKHYQINIDNDVTTHSQHTYDIVASSEEIAIDIPNDKKHCSIPINNKNWRLTDCSYLLRLSNALKYYNSLKLPQNTNKRNKFIDFCVNHYSMFVEDYIHLICNHSHSFHQISIAFQCDYNLNQCCYDAYQCPWTQQHYLNHNNKHNPNFYINMFNTIHVNLFHLQEIGLHSSKQILTITNKNDIKENDIDYYNCIDLKFAQLQKK
eukprot:253066_1